MTHSLLNSEWRRILARLRRQGAKKTSAHVEHLIRSRPPLWFTTRLVKRFLKTDEFEAAGAVIEAVDRSGTKDPLMDDLHSSWLWCIGKHRAALSFAIKSAHFWKKSYIVHKVGTLYRCMADRQKSDYYRRKSEHYWCLAHALAEREERENAQQTARTRKSVRSAKMQT